MDGLLQSVTRSHKDIDLFVNIDDKEFFIDILRDNKFITRRIFKNSILALGEGFKIDIHFLEEFNEEFYTLDLGNRNNPIPLPKRGFSKSFNATIDSVNVRAVSWEVLYLNKTLYKLIFPKEELRKKDRQDIEIIKQNLTSDQIKTIKEINLPLGKGYVSWS